MLLVHPVHEVLRQIPLLIGSLVLGSATGNPVWALSGVSLIVGYGLARWFTTAYRIGPDELQLRTGVLQRKVLSLPRNRIRSVSTDARLLHRLLGLTVLQVSTGQQAGADTSFALDAVPAREVPALRATLLAEALAPPGPAGSPGRMLARWHPSWLRYSALSFNGLLMIAAAFGVLYQAGAVATLQDSGVIPDPADMVGSALITVLVIVTASVVLSVLQSLLTYANLELRRDADLLHLSHGLLRVREHTFDMRRLRGGSLREPLVVRLFGGARLDAVMTGVAGVGEASQLLPPCPRGTAESVLAELIGHRAAVDGPLRAHGAAATRRRWTRALAVPSVFAVPLAVGLLPGWGWIGWAVLALCCALLAFDRARSLGHRVVNGWLVARAGSVERRRDCIASDGIVGWTVRQTPLQRRAGVATLVAATAAGVKRYQILDVPAEVVWSIAADVSGWLADTHWVRCHDGGATKR
ncbi:MAG: PH domain-containing protein [Mycolicibacterium sp.]|uniref:PH domain-containing protein n=1 Tax=Mycolicibacterium sp. TaxID=2320850 RepID=UPI003D0DE227